MDTVKGARGSGKVLLTMIFRETNFMLIFLLGLIFGVAGGLFAWAMLDPGDIVITEDPSYMAAINVFTNHGGVCRGVHCDADGILTDETRIDSPYIAMQTALLSEGVVLSNELGRSVTVDEIKKMAKSIAIRDQETPFGTIHYDFDEYKPE